MVVRIRLARFGRKKSPLYKIVVANQRTARNRQPIEVIGTYNPIPIVELTKTYKDVKLDMNRAKYWLGVGAQPSDTVAFLLNKVDLIPKKPLARDWFKKVEDVK